jgi:hypothetical protein
MLPLLDPKLHAVDHSSLARQLLVTRAMKTTTGTSIHEVAEEVRGLYRLTHGVRACVEGAGASVACSALDAFAQHLGRLRDALPWGELGVTDTLMNDGEQTDSYEPYDGLMTVLVNTRLLADRLAPPRFESSGPDAAHVLWVRRRLRALSATLSTSARSLFSSQSRARSTRPDGRALAGPEECRRDHRLEAERRVTPSHD